MPACRLIALVLLATLLSVAVGGCRATAGNALDAGAGSAGDASARPTAVGERYASRQISRIELQHEVMRFAERLINDFTGQTFLIQTRDMSPLVRARVRAAEHNAVSNAVSIAIGPDPVVNLLDMVVYVTLSRMNLDRLWGALLPGVDMTGMRRVLTNQEKAVWAIAARILTPEYQQALRRLIREWWTRHPEATAVSRVRFGNFAEILEDSKFAEVSETGFLLPEISGATQAVDEVRDLSERLLFYLKYVPFLARTTVDTGLYDALRQPEALKLQSNITRFTDAAERVSLTAAQLPADFARERQALTDTLMEQEERLRALSASLTETLAAGDAMAAAVDQAARSIDAMLEGVRKGRRPGARPFDIRDYAETAKEITRAAQQLDALLAMLGQLPSAPGLDDGLSRLEATVDSLLVKAVIGIGALVLVSSAAFFIALFAFRTASRRFLRDSADGG